MYNSLVVVVSALCRTDNIVDHEEGVIIIIIYLIAAITLLVDIQARSSTFNKLTELLCPCRVQTGWKA